MKINCFAGIAANYVPLFTIGLQSDGILVQKERERLNKT